MVDLRQERVSTAVGALVLLTDGAGQVRVVDWEDCAARMSTLLARAFGASFRIEHGSSHVSPSSAALKLKRFFAGDLAAIDQIDVEPAGTCFHNAVWRALRGITAGKTKTYGDVAKELGRPNAARAVGFANGANPISVIIPCHRLVGAQGALTGYAGGIDRKRWLLSHERNRGADGCAVSWPAPC